MSNLEGLDAQSFNIQVWQNQQLNFGQEGLNSSYTGFGNSSEEDADADNELDDKADHPKDETMNNATVQPQPTGFAVAYPHLCAENRIVKLATKSKKAHSKSGPRLPCCFIQPDGHPLKDKLPNFLHTYVHDGPQEPGEANEDYRARRLLAGVNMNQIHRDRPCQPLRAADFAKRSGVDAVRNSRFRNMRVDSKLHDDRLKRDLEYAAGWRANKLARQATNEQNREIALAHLRAMPGYENLPTPPPPEDSGDELYDWSQFGPIKPKREINLDRPRERGHYKKNRKAATNTTKVEDLNQVLVPGSRCIPCYEGKRRKCNIENGAPCTNCNGNVEACVVRYVWDIPANSASSSGEISERKKRKRERHTSNIGKFKRARTSMAATPRATVLQPHTSTPSTLVPCQTCESYGCPDLCDGRDPCQLCVNNRQFCVFSQPQSLPPLHNLPASGDLQHVPTNSYIVDQPPNTIEPTNVSHVTTGYGSSFTTREPIAYSDRIPSTERHLWSNSNFQNTNFASQSPDCYGNLGSTGYMSRQWYLLPGNTGSQVMGSQDQVNLPAFAPHSPGSGNFYTGRQEGDQLVGTIGDRLPQKLPPRSQQSYQTAYSAGNQDHGFEGPFESASQRRPVANSFSGFGTSNTANNNYPVQNTFSQAGASILLSTTSSLDSPSVDLTAGGGDSPNTTYNNPILFPQRRQAGQVFLTSLSQGTGSSNWEPSATALGSHAMPAGLAKADEDSSWMDLINWDE